MVKGRPAMDLTGVGRICTAFLHRRQLQFDADGAGPLRPGEARVFELEPPPMLDGGGEAVGFWLADVQFC